jgi:REP element-mobilizing transposase RayT
MGQSLVQNYIHIIFSTKHRQKFIKHPYDKKLYSFIGNICNKNNCQVIIVGGHVDHVHILCMLSQNIMLCELVKNIKAKSSKSIKTLSNDLSNFYWQDGYGAFSVNPYQVDIVKQYILNQHQHHKKRDYKNEYRWFLKKYKVNYNEKYVWD